MKKHRKLKLPLLIIFAIIILAKISLGDDNVDLSGSVSISGPTILKVGESGEFIATKDDSVSFAGGEGWTINGDTATKTITMPTTTPQEPLDVTCTITGSEGSYTAHYNCNWYDVIIKKDDNEITQQPIEVWAGQKISLTAKIIPDGTGKTIETTEWTIPEKRIKNYVWSENSSNVEELPESDLSLNNINFYWYDGNDNGITKSVDCTVKIDGDTTEYILETTFKVKKPDNEVSWNEGYVICNSDYIDISDEVWLAFGLHTSTHPGIIAWYRGAEPSEGNLSWIQIGQISYHVYKYFAFDEIVFDHGFDFYKNRCSWCDSPGIEARFNTWRMDRGDTFNVALMFKPDTPNSIYVPVKRITWSWTGIGVKGYGDWSLSSVSHSINESTPEFLIWDKKFEVGSPVFE